MFKLLYACFNIYFIYLGLKITKMSNGFSSIQYFIYSTLFYSTTESKISFYYVLLFKKTESHKGPGKQKDPYF